MLERDFVSRLSHIRKTTQKWWDILWSHDIYQLALCFHPKYRVDFLQNVVRRRSDISAKEKEAIIQEKQAKMKVYWQEWLVKIKTLKKAEISYNQNTQKGKERRRRETDLRITQAKFRTIGSFTEEIFGKWETPKMDEFEEYISEPTQKLKEGETPLKWWTSVVQQSRWPYLSQFAVQILSFPPMSAEAERIFSGARRTISWERSRLKPDIIEAVECLHHCLEN
jgi:hypothetical protein